MLGAPAPLTRALEDLPREDDPDPLEGDLCVLAGTPLPVPNRVCDERRHLRSALQRRDLLAVVPAGADGGEERSSGGHQRIRLAERRQDLLDVAQEHRVGPEHEYPTRREAGAVGIEEIRGAVERHGRLSCSWAALYDERSGHVRTNHLVLLALDGRDDVAHVARALPRECRQQSGIAV